VAEKVESVVAFLGKEKKGGSENRSKKEGCKNERGNGLRFKI
jgi:hypothetical protein